MSSQLGIGVPVPKFLPVTGTWTLPFVAYLSFLSHRVVFDRLNSKQWIGDRSSPGKDRDELEVDSRAHANFLENVPLAFTLAAVAELNGANRKYLNYAMAALFALRLLHAELGIKREESMGFGRPAGFWGTQGWLIGVAGYSAYLVKGYWGY
ncbi:uncharacterized protein KY384_000890 [Bacidia gigantensis]|uniref:uncharacterized protein n=1 Tax=Bacidia gigantensis TaxID=2732470 RepID=UPI001D0365CD|nr:uncharacterized protein KY384_000890 [Bacidia gigantensis]KAG8534047.1 hypothetical protein KY384_000890 [Bacidia gigantensis]